MGSDVPACPTNGGQQARNRFAQVDVRATIGLTQVAQNAEVESDRSLASRLETNEALA